MAEGAPRGNSDLRCRRAACWYGIFLSRQLRAAFSGGEIHSLGRLRLEGFPESLSRTWELVHRNVGFGLRGICHASKRLSCSVSLSCPWAPILPIHGRVTNMIQQLHKPEFTLFLPDNSRAYLIIHPYILCNNANSKKKYETNKNHKIMVDISQSECYFKYMDVSTP